jgi:hypothetical protein
VGLQIAPPEKADSDSPTKVREARAKAAGTNKDYIGLADKLLKEEPEVFRQVQANIRPPAKGERGFRAMWGYKYPHIKLAQIIQRKFARSAPKQRARTLLTSPRPTGC